jgi:hypothetical protein
MLRGKLGFVHQVLTFVRTRPDSISGKREEYHINVLSRRVLLERYGRRVLDQTTFESRRRALASRHYRVLGEALLFRRPKPFWDFHFGALADAGLRASRVQIALGAFVVCLRWLFNLESSIRSLVRWLNTRRASQSHPTQAG